MSDWMAIRRDVSIAMARTVIEKTGFSQSTYHEGIVPSSEPMDGFGANVAHWAYILGIVESRLEGIHRQYAVFDVSKNFVRSSRNQPIWDTNNKIADVIYEQLSSFEGAING